jgi:hypothetical protein
MRNTIFLLLIAGSVELTARGDHGSSISLTVTVNQYQQYASLGLPTVVQSDLQNPQTHVPIPYTDGQNGVCASIASTGVLTIDFDCQGVSSPRRLDFTNFPMSLFAPPSPPGSSTCSASESTFTPPYTNRIGAGAASGGTPFQSMKIYPSETTTPYNVEVFIATQLPTTSGTTNAYRLDYDYNAEFADGALASPAQVWRLSETEWVVESAPSSSIPIPNTSTNPPSTYPNAAMLVEQSTTKHMSNTAECGFYQVPFSLTLDAQ